MKTCILLIMLLFSSSVYSQSMKEKDACRKQISELLQKTDPHYADYASLIRSSRRMVCYLIDPKVTSMELSGKTLVNGEILDRKSAKSKLSSKLDFIKSISSQRKKTGPSVVRESTFMPDVTMRFRSRKGLVTVSCSSYDNMVRMAKAKDEYVEFEDREMCSMIIDKALAMFPQDKYLRNLQRKRK